MNGFGMGVGWLIPIILIVGLVYFLNDNERRGNRNRASAKEILDVRLAKGEITKEEYEELFKALHY